MKAIHEPASDNQLAAYFSLILLGCAGHVLLFILTLVRNVKNSLVLLNLHFGTWPLFFSLTFLMFYSLRNHSLV